MLKRGWGGAGGASLRMRIVSLGNKQRPHIELHGSTPGSAAYLTEDDVPEQIDDDAGSIGWPTYELDSIDECLPNGAINYSRTHPIRFSPLGRRVWGGIWYFY